MSVRSTESAVLVLLAGFSAGGVAQHEVEGTRFDMLRPPGQAYASLETRHQYRVFVDESGSRREPAVQVRAQIGNVFYSGGLDIFATVGAEKVPQTRQVSLLRPTIEANAFVLREEGVQVLGYALTKLPFVDEELLPSQMGTELTVGMVAGLQYHVPNDYARLRLRLGTDAWTRFYSRRQYAESRNAGEDPADRLFLVPEEPSPEPPVERVEDYAPHGNVLGITGIEATPRRLAELQVRLDGYYDLGWRPQYWREAGQVRYMYRTERSTYYRLRLRWQASARTTLLNDLLHFHEGFFARQMRGDTNRLRNIARIIYRF